MFRVNPEHSRHTNVTLTVQRSHSRLGRHDHALTSHPDGFPDPFSEFLDWKFIYGATILCDIVETPCASSLSERSRTPWLEGAASSTVGDLSACGTCTATQSLETHMKTEERCYLSTPGLEPEHLKPLTAIGDR